MHDQTFYHIYYIIREVDKREALTPALLLYYNVRLSFSVAVTVTLLFNIMPMLFNFIASNTNDSTEIKSEYWTIFLLVSFVLCGYTNLTMVFNLLGKYRN